MANGTVEVGGVYVLREKDPPTYGVIVKSFEDGKIFFWETGIHDSEKDFVPKPFYGSPEQFLERYQPIAPEQREALISELREKGRVIAEKISLLEQTVDLTNPSSAQSQPKCTTAADL